MRRKILQSVAVLVAAGFVTPTFLAAPATVAQKDQQHSRPFAPGTCGPVDPSYIRVAEATGGQPLFLRPSELTMASRLMAASNSDAILWAKGTLTGETREFELPIDSSAKRVTLSLSFDKPGTTLVLHRPSGATAAPEDAAVEISDWTCGRIVTLGAPEAGTWRAQLQGNGHFWLKVQAQSELFVVSVEFVAKGGRPGHEGLFKIPGQPLAGRPQTLEVNLSGTIRTADFRLVSEGAETLQPLPMQEVGYSPEDHEFVGILALPAQPFRVAVTGVDGSGMPFQRMYLTQFQATSVEIVPTGGVEELRAGATNTLTFVVRNHGDAAPFRALALDDHQFVTQVEPVEFTLERGASTQVRVDLAVPALTPPGTGVTLTLTVTSITNPEITNGTVAELSVAGP